MPDWTLTALRGRLQTSLDGAPSQLVVDDVHTGDAEHPGALLLDITAHHDGRVDRWRLRLPDAARDLGHASLDSAALIVRANLEEWWHTRHIEPATAQLAHKLP